MAQKRTIEDARRVAIERGGECLSMPEVMRSIQTKLRWKCKVGHEWDARFASVFYTGSWCPKCAGVQRLTLADAQSDAIKMGGLCLSTEYKTAITEMDWECQKGHRWKAVLANIRNRAEWCPHCTGNVRKTIEDAQTVALSRGGICISHSSEMISIGSKLRWSCQKGHRWKASYRDVFHSGSWCPRCRGRISKAERDLFAFVLTFYPDAQSNVRRLLREPRFELDIWIPSLSAAVEFDGDHWHSFPSSIERDARKDLQCSERGITLFRVKENRWTMDSEKVRKELLQKLQSLDMR